MPRPRRRPLAPLLLITPFLSRSLHLHLTITMVVSRVSLFLSNQNSGTSSFERHLQTGY